MKSSLKPLFGGPVRSNVADLYMVVVRLEIATTTITTQDPTVGVGFTVAHDGTAGDYTVTFDEDRKPKNILFANVLLEEDLPLESAKWTGYTPSTGVGTFTFYDGATETQVNYTGTAVLVMYCSNNSLSDSTIA